MVAQREVVPAVAITTIIRRSDLPLNQQSLISFRDRLHCPGVLIPDWLASVGWQMPHGSQKGSTSLDFCSTFDAEWQAQLQMTAEWRLLWLLIR